MSKSYILTPHSYLYAFIDNLNGPSLSQVITGAELAVDDNIITYQTGHPSILNSGDKLIVHGTEIHESLWKELCKSLYYQGLECVYDYDNDCWRRGYKVFRIGVNSEGDCISVLTDLRVYKNRTFRLPFKFDWSSYGVIVPNSTNAKIELKGDIKMKQQIEEDNHCLKLQLKTYLTKLHEKDEKLEKRKNKIKLLKKQVHLKEKEEVRIEELKQQVANLDQQLKSKDEWVRELVSQIVGSDLVTKVTLSTVGQQQESEKLNQKLDLMITMLRNI